VEEGLVRIREKRNRERNKSGTAEGDTGWKESDRVGDAETLTPWRRR
jgi:hypothetical protein